MDILHIFLPPPFKLFPHFKYQHFIGKTCTYLFVLQIRPTGNSYFQFQKRWRMTIANYCSEISKREKQEIRSFLLIKQPRNTRSKCVIDANFMTLELYYNTKLGAVIDRNKDTRCITICVFHIAIYRITFFCVSLHL